MISRVNRTTPLMLLYIVVLLTPGMATNAQLSARIYDSTTVHCYDAELLKTDSSQLYLWITSPSPINTDFQVEITIDSSTRIDCHLAEVVGRMAVTNSLPDSVIAQVTRAESIVLQVVLYQSSISDEQFIIGTPAVFREKLAMSGLLDFSSSVIPYNFKSLPSLDNAEIELEIERIDLLLIPESGVSDQMRCKYQVYPTNFSIEWYLLLDLPDDDLYGAALCYCLKGLLAGKPVSTVIDPTIAENIFPRYKPYARSLFSQIPADRRQRHCLFPDGSMFPNIISSIEKEVSKCGGNLTFTDSCSAGTIQLRFAIVPDDSIIAINNAVGQMLRDVEQTAMSWSDRFPKIESNDSLNMKYYRNLSRQLSENIWLIPLGQSQLMLVAGREVHHLSNNADRFRIADFYRVSEK